MFEYYRIPGFDELMWDTDEYWTEEFLNQGIGKWLSNGYYVRTHGYKTVGELCYESQNG